MSETNVVHFLGHPVLNYVGTEGKGWMLNATNVNKYLIQYPIIFSIISMFHHISNNPKYLTLSQSQLVRPLQFLTNIRVVYLPKSDMKALAILAYLPRCRRYWICEISAPMPPAAGIQQHCTL